MILNELYDRSPSEYQDLEQDNSQPQLDQLRKTRLTLRQIKKLREMMVKMHEVFNYKFLPVQHTNAHARCVHISAQHFPGELLAGTMETRLHFQTSGDNMPDELKQRDKGTPIFKRANTHTG